MRTIIIIFLFFQIQSAIGCDCVRIKDLATYQKESFLYSELIFIGELLKTNDDGSYEFQIIELFKGEHPDTNVRGKYHSSCSVIPEMTNEIWIVYADLGENGIVDIHDCGLSRSFEFPFLWHKQASVPPPSDLNNHDLTLSMIKQFQLMTKYKDKALEVLRKEIEQLRKWRNE